MGSGQWAVGGGRLVQGKAKTMLTLLFTTTDQLPTTYCLLLVVTHLLRSGGETRTDHWERSREHAISREEES